MEDKIRLVSLERSFIKLVSFQFSLKLLVFLLVGLGDQILFIGSGDVVFQVILEEGEVVVECKFISAGKSLAILAIDYQLYVCREIPSAILWVK